MDTTSSAWLTVGVLFVGLILWGIRSLYYARARIAALKKAGLPIASGWSWLFGNLLLVNQMYEVVPKQATKVLLFGEIVHQAKTQCCYIDLWPFSRPFFLVRSPHLAAQACQNIPQIAENRPPELQEFFKPLAGGLNLFDLPAAPWRHWRAVFNKGFSNETVSILIPEMVSQSVRYRDILLGYAQRNELFQLDPITLRFAIDFIGQASLNSPMRAQEGYDELADSMLSQVRWMPKIQGPNPFENVNIPRIFMHWWNGRKMDRYIGKQLDARFKEHIAVGAKVESKSIMDLVIKAYLSDEPKRLSSQKMDPEFKSFAIRQIRLFLFVGHDSISSTICYAFHLLASNPSTLSKIRAEHDELFGKDISKTSKAMVENPALLNQLPYTLAVLKETLRLFPPGSAIRHGAGELVGEDGTRYPTKGCIVWVVHVAMHRSAELWPNPDAFLPERWLVEPGHALYPTKNAWRPFEWGPRACIGQSLALTELKIVLVTICRALDFTPGYEEWDRVHKTTGLQQYRGERAFQIEEAAAHPAEHYPCRVALSVAGKKFL